ncbi:general transcriptional corepressor trfA-like [Argopecten irradians]|uniref:general transcriptional corepressor trfA-like n=1 Tax=Argopecten irradians TaxID=31199 RepID=UPI003710B9B2
MGQPSSKVRNKKSGGALFTKKRDPSFLHSTDKVVIEETIIELDNEKDVEADNKNIDRSELFCVENSTKEAVDKKHFNVEIEELDAAIEVVRLTKNVERSTNEEVKSAESKVQVGGKRPSESGPGNPGNNLVQDEDSGGGTETQTEANKNEEKLKECEEEEAQFTGVVKRKFTLEEDDENDSGVQWVPFNKTEGHAEVCCTETEKKHVRFSEEIEEKVLEEVSNEEDSDENDDESSDSSVGEVEEEENDEDSETDNESEESDENTEESDNEENDEKDDRKEENQHASESVGRTSKSPLEKLQITSGKRSKSPPATGNNSVNSPRSGDRTARSEDNKIPSDDLETFMYLQPVDKVVVVQKDMKSFPVKNDKIYISCIKPAVVNETTKPESLTKLQNKNGFSPVQISPRVGTNEYSVKSPQSLTTGYSPTRSPGSGANGYSLTRNLPSVIKGSARGLESVNKKSVNGSSPRLSAAELKVNDKELREDDNKIRNDNFLEPGDSAAYLKVKLGGDEKKNEERRDATPGLYVKETIHKLRLDGHSGQKQRLPVRVRFQQPGTDYRKKPELCLLKLDSFVSSPRTVAKKVGNILRAKENKRYI